MSLSDADNASAISFVQQKLKDSGVDVKFTQQQLAYIDRLGGRASDLESVRIYLYSTSILSEADDIGVVDP